MAVWFLYAALGPGLNNVEDYVPPAVHTQVLDLFHEEWSPIMLDIEKAFQEEGVQEGAEPDLEVNWWNKSRMWMRHGDIRLDLNEIVAVELLDGFTDKLLSCDIFVFQFVLHENSSYIVNKDTGLVTGAVGSILEGAVVGSFLICTDSRNTLWSALKKTAITYGWKYWSDDERVEAGRKIAFGPKAFVVLEREVMTGLTSSDALPQAVNFGNS